MNLEPDFINLKKLTTQFDFQFKQKPLLIGGKAMEYYGLRKAGSDVDLVVSVVDHERLKATLDQEGMIYLPGKNQSGYKSAPQFVDLYGDQGILIFEFESDLAF